MEVSLSDRILQHTELSKRHTYPFIVIVVTTAHSNCTDEHISLFKTDVDLNVQTFLENSLYYKDEKLSGSFELSVNRLIEKTANHISDKHECEGKGITEFTIWAVYRELARQMFSKGFTLRGLDCYVKQMQTEKIMEFSLGLDFDEVKDIGVRDPNRIGNNEQIAELKKIGLSFAKEVLSKDKNKILSYKNLRRLTLDYLRFKHENSNVILEILPSKSDSLKDWFRKDDYTYPIYLSKPGAVSDDVIKARNELIIQTKLEYFK